MYSPLTAVRDAGRRLRARARVTDRLRELSSVSAWRRRSWLDLLGLNRTIGVQAVKIGVASALSWLVAHWAFGSPAPIYAPLTAAFVGLVTLQASIKDGVQRVIGVVVGIAVATFLVDVFGLHAWSIGIVVGLGFLAGKMLRLVPGAAAQIPVTGLLLLALGTASHPLDRVLETLVGAAVAVAVNFLVVPPNHVGAARTAVRTLADQVVDTLSEMAAGIAEPWTLEQAAGWLRTARDRGGVSAAAQTAVDQAGQSLRLHPRRGDWTHVQAAVRRSVRTLGVVEVQTRVIARTLRDTAENLSGVGGVGDTAEARSESGGSDRSGDQPPLPMASDMLTSTAGAIDAFASGMLPTSKSGAAASLGTARMAIDAARVRIAQINDDLGDLVAANLPRGIYLGTLVVETGRILDELDHGLS